MLRSYWISFKRSWIHHTGIQLATLTVLAATFTVICFVLTLSLNLKRVLTMWGETVQLTVYLHDNLNDEKVNLIRSTLESVAEVAAIKFTDKKAATESFKEQMASYAPDLLKDIEFAQPFPASFQVSLKDGFTSIKEASVLESLAKKFSQIDGVEDVSYGQNWVKNYTAFVKTLSITGEVIIFVLICGSLFVIGNSVSSSISSRRDEIEILELVGATASMIRMPFVFEGAFMGGLASLLAIGLNFVIYNWEKTLMQESLTFARVVENLSFLSPFWILSIVICGTVFGALGAYLTARQLNDGWSASSRIEA